VVVVVVVVVAAAVVVVAIAATARNFIMGYLFLLPFKFSVHFNNLHWHENFYVDIYESYIVQKNLWSHSEGKKIVL
jgi:hypothetical protein